MSTIDPNLAGAMLTIDLDALKANYNLLAQKSGTAKAGAAVKGEAYGLGLAPVAKALWQAGCRTFFVARPNEGAELRAQLPQAEIIVLDGLHAGQAPFYAAHELRPALISLDEADEWATFNRARSRAAPSVLHVDSGINRMGLSQSDFTRIAYDAELLRALNITLVMSHLACSDDPKHPLNQQQRNCFSRLRKMLPNIPASLCNSSGIFLGKSYHHDLTRPGVALYGGNPLPSKKNPMKTVATLLGRVMQGRDVPKGETVGYSATWKAPRASRIALLGAGYRDGIPRKLSSTAKNGPAQVWVAGQRCPIVGRVSMDMMAVDVTDVPVAKVHRGTWVEIFGPNISVDESAARAGTISYELLTRLGNRYARRYVGGSE